MQKFVCWNQDYKIGNCCFFAISFGNATWLLGPITLSVWLKFKISMKPHGIGMLLGRNVSYMTKKLGFFNQKSKMATITGQFTIKLHVYGKMKK